MEGMFRPLVRRGEAGVSCDDAGLALSGLALGTACRDASGFVRYRARPRAELMRIFGAPKLPPNVAATCVAEIEDIATSLDKGDALRARRLATRLRVPAAAALALARLEKAGFDGNEPRVPAGNGRPSGQWVTFAVPDYRAQVLANRANRNDARNRFHAAALLCRDR